MTPARRVMYALAGHLGKTVREIEETMPAAEWNEWLHLLGDGGDPWGHFRNESLFMYGLSNLIAAPHAAKPGEMIGDLKLPWVKSKAPKVQEIGGDRLAAWLISAGAKVVEANAKQ
jgi:hypothetical protein